MSTLDVHTIASTSMTCDLMAVWGCMRHAVLPRVCHMNEVNIRDFLSLSLYPSLDIAGS